MSDLIVLAFDNEGGAIEMRDKLLSMQKSAFLSIRESKQTTDKG